MTLIRNYLEKLNFILWELPEYQDLDYKKDAKLIISADNFTVGDMPYQKGWRKDFVYGEDPLFSPYRPWAQHLSSPDNIYTEDGLIKIKHEAFESKDGWMESNLKIKYGTVKAVIKMPSVTGAWSAFWLFGTNELPEIDIEHCGCWKHKVTATHHWGYDYKKYNDHLGFIKKMTRNNARHAGHFTPTEKFYLYEFELTPWYTATKINGRVVRKMRKGVGSSSNTIIFDVSSGTYCNSVPIDELAVMEIKEIIINKIE